VKTETIDTTSTKSNPKTHKSFYIRVDGCNVKLNFRKDNDHKVIDDVKRSILVGAIKCEKS
jgi:hypothetical protein